MHSTSVSLLDRVRENDDAAWERFVDIYGPLVFSWCRRSGNLSQEDSADVMQEVFQSVAGAVQRFQRSHAGELRAWLRTITTNKIRDFYRKQRSQAQSIGGSTIQHRLSQVPEISISENEDEEKAILTRRALEVMKTDFDQSSWQAFWKSAIDGLTAAEIAEELNITRQAVWQACYRIRKRLREELTGMLEN